MAAELRRISLDNIQDVVEVTNGSSSGRTFAFGLDFAQFVMLSRFWNFSWQHSWLAAVRGAPAGVVLNTVDPDAREAYSFYWGVLPEFRRARVSMQLVYTYLDQVRREGYLRTHADVSADSPLTIYEKLGFRPAQELLELRTAKVVVPEECAPAVHPLALDELLERVSVPVAAPAYWTRRAFFLRHAAPFLEVLGAFHGDTLEAYVVLTRWPGYTVLVQFVPLSDTDGPARALLGAIAAGDYPGPFIAPYLTPGARPQQILESAGFGEPRSFVSLTLEL